MMGVRFVEHKRGVRLHREIPVSKLKIESFYSFQDYLDWLSMKAANELWAHWDYGIVCCSYAKTTCRNIYAISRSVHGWQKWTRPSTSGIAWEDCRCAWWQDPGPQKLKRKCVTRNELQKWSTHDSCMDAHLRTLWILTLSWRIPKSSYDRIWNKHAFYVHRSADDCDGEDQIRFPWIVQLTSGLDMRAVKDILWIDVI